MHDFVTWDVYSGGSKLGVYLRMLAQFEVIIVVSVEECVVARFEVKVVV